MKTYLYILYVAKETVNPGEDDVDEIFYVGRTTVSIQTRLIQHLSEARRGSSSPKCQYIRKTWNERRAVAVKEISTTDSTDLNEISKVEDNLIVAYKEYGYTLFNQRSGFSGSHKGCNARVDWNEENLALLGTDYDDNIAERLNCKKPTICQKRKLLGIPAFRIHEWTEDEDKLIGTMFDCQLAEILGISRGCVNARRKELGIVNFSAYTWNDDFEKMLGKMSDYKLAQVSNTSRGFVQHKRLRQGIPPFQQYVWSEDILTKLGKMPDKQLAQEVGCTVQTIAYKRKQLNIPVYNRHLAKSPLGLV
jgi:hypothetical protein